MLPDIAWSISMSVGEGFFGELMDCFYCLSLWMAVPVAWAIGAGVTERVLMWLAFSGGAILVERISKERTNGMLWTTAGDGVNRKAG